MSDKQIVKAGNGRLPGAINTKAQPGKVATLFDGEITLCQFKLDEPFKIPYMPENEEEQEVSLNIAFVTNLQVETDGEIDILWQ